MGLDFVKKQFEHNGLEVKYHQHVKADSTATPIVLVHGTGGSTALHYQELFPLLAEHQTVYSIDLETDLTKKKVELEEYAQQVIHLIVEELGLKEVTLLGFSLGAVVATYVASQIPDVVVKLIPVAGWVKTDGSQKLRNEAMHKVGKAQIEPFMDILYWTLLSDKFLAQFSVETLQRDARARPLKPEGAYQVALCNRIDITDALPQITAQTLVIGCEQDRLSPYWQSELLTEKIQNARMVSSPTGHGIFFEQPGKAAPIITQFNQDPSQFALGETITGLFD